MSKEKIILKKNTIQKLIENEIKNFSHELDNTMGDLGGDEGKSIDYTKKPETSGKETEFKLKEPIPELLEYLTKLEEARSILSKIAAGHNDDETRKRIYSHYEKNNKLGLEMIKEFGIVH